MCYERDPSLDYEGNVGRPYCQWAYGEEPAPPEEFSFTRQVFVSFQPTDEQPCDPCDVERFDELLRAKVEAECDQPYELVRGCYASPDDVGNDYCWVMGLYHSDCDPGP